MANDLQTKLDAIKLDKDTNLLPENLKAGVTCLGVTGTLTAGEDLQEQLNAQDLIIQQLQEEVAHKASGSAKPNIFVQETEPKIKQGLWLKTNNSYNSIQCVNSINTENFWNSNLEHKFNPVVQLSSEYASEIIGDNLYLIGNGQAIKYDMTNDTFETFTIDKIKSNKDCCVVGNTIYLSGGPPEENIICAYNTTTNSYDTVCEHQKTYTGYSCIVTDGQYCYLLPTGFISNSSTANYQIYKWNITDETNNLTYLNSIDYLGADNGACAAILNNYIYLFCFSRNKYYKYSITDNTVTSITPVNASSLSNSFASCCVVGTDIYIHVSRTSSGLTNYLYKYDTITNVLHTVISYENLNSRKINIVYYDDSLYLLGAGDISGTASKVFTLKDEKVFNENELIIVQNKFNHYTKLTDENINFYFDDIYITDENGVILNNISKYYGNGTEWIQI